MLGFAFRRAFTVGGASMMAAALMAACASGSSDGSTTSTSTGTSGTSTEIVRFDKEIQQQLIDVGCYTGSIDGEVGPETDGAIVAFQMADDLETDGEIGPKTAARLTKAVAAGEVVCIAGGENATPTGTCTAQALAMALDGAVITTYICSDGYAAGSDVIGGGAADAAFLLERENGAWVSIAADVCGAAGAGVPPAILEAGCVS